MNEEFVPYEETLALNKLGFDTEDYFGWYNEDKIIHNYYPTNAVPTPLYQQAFRWFREKGYHCGIIPRYDEFHYFIKDFVNDKEYDDVYNISSYEEAELACLRKLIDLVNQNKEDE